MKIHQIEKLVRDLIPDIISDKGHKPIFSQLNNVNYQQKLADKLLEEAQEVVEAIQNPQKDFLTEELADVLEVIYNIARIKGIERQSIENARKAKNYHKGSFKNQIYLESVEVTSE